MINLIFSLFWAVVFTLISIYLIGISLTDKILSEKPDEKNNDRWWIYFVIAITAINWCLFFYLINKT